eukprot:1139512-Pelagomonas_calceolata.AAC.1
MELLLLRCQCARSLPLPSMSGRVLAQHTRALPGDTAWRRLTSPPDPCHIHVIYQIHVISMSSIHEILYIHPRKAVGGASRWAFMQHSMWSGLCTVSLLP